MRYIHLLRTLTPFPDGKTYDSGVYGETEFNVHQMAHFVSTGAAVWFDVDENEKARHFDYPHLSASDMLLAFEMMIK